MSYSLPDITLEELPKRGAREDFRVRLVGPGDTDYSFPLSITYTALGIWQVAGAEAATALARVLAEVHGTAKAFPDGGFWFDSYNSGDSLKETCYLLRARGWKAYLVPAARESLGGDLFDLLDDLNATFIERYRRLFLKPLDVLYEKSQALEDLESEAKDHPHFIYRICILSGVVDRFDFDQGEESLNGLIEWLESVGGTDLARELTVTFRMLKRLRRQYPIHEEFAVDADGERTRRSDVVAAEEYFELEGDYPHRWRLVFRRFVEDTSRLVDYVKEAPVG